MKYLFAPRHVKTPSHYTSAGNSAKKRKTEREIDDLYKGVLSSLKPMPEVKE